jgi:hypothetical protein
MLHAIGKKDIYVLYDSKSVSIEDESRDLKVTAVFVNGKEA